MKCFLIFLFLFCFNSCFCQFWGDSTILHQDIFYTVEKNPQFGNSVNEYYKFIADNLLIESGTIVSLMKNVVTVKIVVSKSGKIVYAEVTDGINETCNRAVLDLIKKMPSWSPGKQNGKPVSCFVNLPILII
ncbi:hypothetical protein DC498_13800 [Terrimonas sp.]|uniref:energy transducer TonB n=1 Tax=Terrimonas sp. TaxID=1914338 RepID=UPI000D50FFB7|nr:energy transducer TonB [Terrimonas sp.]PVD51780.1 hypothetical protein DC498_13800 [Terrimonas sp.]